MTYRADLVLKNTAGRPFDEAVGDGKVYRRRWPIKTLPRKLHSGFSSQVLRELIAADVTEAEFVEFRPGRVQLMQSIHHVVMPDLERPTLTEEERRAVRVVLRLHEK